MKAYIVEITSIGRYYASKSRNNLFPLEEIVDSKDCLFDTKEEAFSFMKKMKYLGKLRVVETTTDIVNDYFKARNEYNERSKEFFNSLNIEEFKGINKEG